jgi:hypothetical protein
VFIISNRELYPPLPAYNIDMSEQLGKDRTEEDAELMVRIFDETRPRRPIVQGTHTPSHDLMAAYDEWLEDARAKRLLAENTDRITD